WQSLCCENLRLLRPKGLTMTQKRNLCPLNRYKNKFPAPPPRKPGIWLLANEISRKMVTKYQ
ncbi:MAG: hypothetical protein KAY65_17490, partial [Planctomycetes bacterium]|nr:hypothetical protein [Planctomycetota bacterium]